MMPLGTGQRRTSGYTVPGKVIKPGENIGQDNWVTPGYFRTVGISLLRGRDFTMADDSSHGGVIVVSESFAKHFADASREPAPDRPIAISVPGGNSSSETNRKPLREKLSTSTSIGRPSAPRKVLSLAT